MKRFYLFLLLCLPVSVSGYGTAAEEAPPGKAPGNGAAAVEGAKENKPDPKPGVFKYVLAEKPMMMTRFTSRFVKKSSQDLEKKVKAPTAKKTFYSSIRGFGNSSMICCLTSNNEDGSWEHLILDLNNNKDLTDDPVLKLPEKRKMGTLSVKYQGTEHRFAAKLADIRNMAYLTLYPQSWFEGTLAIGKTANKAMVLDGNLDGKINPGDLAFVDFNGDGAFRGGMEYRKPIGKSPFFAGEAWKVLQAGPEGKSLQLADSTEEMRKLTFDMSAITKVKKGDLTLYLSSKVSNVLPFKEFDLSQSIPVPSDHYRQVSVALKLKEGLLRFSLRNLKINEDKTIKLERPQMKISVNQSKGKISVGQKIVAPHGVLYGLAKGKKGPLVEIFDPKKPETPPTQGNMAYG